MRIPRSALTTRSDILVRDGSAVLWWMQPSNGAALVMLGTLAVLTAVKCKRGAYAPLRITIPRTLATSWTPLVSRYGQT